MLISNHVWRLLVQDRGWSADEYEAWLAEAMIAAAAEPQP